MKSLFLLPLMFILGACAEVKTSLKDISEDKLNAVNIKVW